MAATKNAQLVKNDTKEFITQALIVLLKKSNLSDITISKVVLKAGVSRTAFYRNFESLHQVLYEHFKDKFGSIFMDMRNFAEESDRLDSYVSFFNDFSEDIILSVSRGYEPIINEIFIGEIENFYGNSHNSYHIAFMAAGAYAAWKKWLFSGSKDPIKTITDTIGVFSKAMHGATQKSQGVVA